MMMMNTVRFEMIWDFLEDNGIATADEVLLVIEIAGATEETLNKILFARTGYHTMEEAKLEMMLKKILDK